MNRAAVQATTFGPKCPQSPPSVPTAKFNPGDEDCLFLNVYAPVVPHGKSLPVMIWIHPGGYGLQDGTQDMSEIINANNNGFVAVAIQYRVGGFYPGLNNYAHFLSEVPVANLSFHTTTVGGIWFPLVCRGQEQRRGQRGTP